MENLELAEKRTSEKSRLAPILLTLGLLLLWETASQLRWISAIFFPAPTAVGKAVWTLLTTGILMDHLIATLTRVGGALLLGGIAGIATGWLIGTSRRARLLIEPFVSAFHPLPKLAMFPLFLIVLGIGEESKVAVVAVSVLFPVLINTQAGVLQIERNYWDVVRNFGASPWEVFTKIVVPGSLPMTLVGLKLGLNTALILTVAVEMLTARVGLGALVWESWNSLRVGNLFAVLVVLMLVGLAGNGLFTFADRTLLPWRPKELP